jgi:hypothetical protein
MENQTRFDLNSALQNWRQELAALPSLGLDDRRELETHLRDGIADLSARGLNEEESFWLARRRVGKPLQLAEEFAKDDPVKVWCDRLFWSALGILGWDLWTNIFNTLWTTAFWSPKSVDMSWIWIRQIIVCAVPLLVMAQIVRGSLTGRTSWPFRFKSRLHLVLSCLGMIALALGLELVCNSMLVMKYPSGSRVRLMWQAETWTRALGWTLLQFSWPLLLVAAIAWLAPSKHRTQPPETSD